MKQDSVVSNRTITSNTSTGSGNTAAIVVFSDSASATLLNTIVANNIGSSQCSLSLGGIVIDGGGNLQFPDSDCGGTITVANPLLGSLTNNGGPTQTMRLSPASPAVDSGIDAGAPVIDQRSFPRPIDILNKGNDGSDTTDIGAFELQQNEIPTLTQWGMIIFVVFTGIGAVYYLRRQQRVPN